MVAILDGNDKCALRRAVTELRAGSIVAFPTETVYGLGANALDETAVAKIFSAKKRPSFDPLIVHVETLEDVVAYTGPLGENALLLGERFWPGPLTLVLPKRPIIPDIVTAGFDTVAIRIPSHPIARALLAEVAFPIAAPSANKFGYVSPTTASHVERSLGDYIDLILDGGPCTVGVESTVCIVNEAGVSVLRPGGITLEQLAEAVGPVSLGNSSLSAMKSPGALPSHYAPVTRITLVPASERLPAPRYGERLGSLSLMSRTDSVGYLAKEVLSEKGDMEEAAAKLFAALRRLDDVGLDRIIAEIMPEEGIGLAVMDRLRRAAQREGG